MKKLLALMLLVSAIVMVGCGGGEGTEADAKGAVRGGMNPNTSDGGGGGAPVEPK